MLLKRLLSQVGIASFIAFVCAGEAYATFTFTNVQVTTNSVSFNINGDMTGYTAPAGWSNQFGIQYKGNIWVGTGSSANTWSGNIFDNHSFNNGGNTGEGPGWGSMWAYTWSWQDSYLGDAVSTNRDVTVTFGGNYLDPTATGEMDFVWGWANSAGNATILKTVDFNRQSVPEPSSLALLGVAGLGLMLSLRRKIGL